MRLHVWFVLLAVAFLSTVVASGASAATVCNPGGDVCVVSSGFAGLQSDIATAGAPAAITQMLTREVALSQALHPPGPCFEGAFPPGPPCVPTPSSQYLPSEYLLVLIDYQVGALSGLLPRAGCVGGCSFPPAAAHVIDGDIRAILADRTLFPPGAPSLPAFTG
ncbi:MAG: hypothetical protein QOK32_1698 [Gaiellaceae bacterium]|jgi:hypothetical protein|nr:hypothetical protein [Gaiellaceae bacterium]MDX6492664.1 hypothetical protein [Gaiellaceae bacterium]MDX6508352.1 hypothetical protein [Gaiellaceae bacterium]MDX6544095.1 hypothetical protein [Gaiellaceae bacterium]